MPVNTTDLQALIAQARATLRNTDVRPRTTSALICNLVDALEALQTPTGVERLPMTEANIVMAHWNETEDALNIHSFRLGARAAERFHKIG